MSTLKCDSYLLPKDIRNLFFVGGAFGVLGIAGFSAFMMYLAATSGNNIGTYAMIACLFAALAAYCIIEMFRNSKIVNMRYAVDNNAAFFFYGKKAIRVYLNAPFTQVKMELPLAIAKGTLRLEYLLLKDKPFNIYSINRNRGIKVLLDLWQSEIVVIPMNALPLPVCPEDK